MPVEALKNSRWERLSEILAARTGLHFPPERRADLRRALDQAAADFGLADADSCANWLLSTPLSTGQLARLARHLTIGETYFFRERPSFEALASHVLPQLIERKRGQDRQLRLWSAACSTGEEAYSLAMLIQQVLPDWREWKISILATDINPHVLSKAEAAVYGEWSFRDCPAELRERFFTPAGDRHHRVQQDVRSMVRFEEFNLSQHEFPAVARQTQSMDLILCRNLLIYFTPEHARRLAGNLRRCLVDDGWLLVSPSECSQALFPGFAPVNFPGSILYRKCATEAPPGGFAPPAEARAGDVVPALSEREVAHMLTPATPPFRATTPERPPAEGECSPSRFAAAESLYAAGQYADAAALLQLVAGQTDAEHRVAALALLTRALANLGRVDEALAASERWIDADKLDPAAHYLHAMVLQELGDRTRARTSLQRAVYLHPDFALAHFALGNQARAAARHAEARRHYENAARLLRGHAADEAVAESEGLTAGRLREIIGALAARRDA